MLRKAFQRLARNLVAEVSLLFFIWIFCDLECSRYLVDITQKYFVLFASFDFCWYSCLIYFWIEFEFIVWNFSGKNSRRRIDFLPDCLRNIDFGSRKSAGICWQVFYLLFYFYFSCLLFLFSFFISFFRIFSIVSENLYPEALGLDLSSTPNLNFKPK